jgi:hypothetical protein
MARFWVSWISGNYEDEGCTAPSFKFWVTGQIGRPNWGLTPEQFIKTDEFDSEEALDAFLDEHARDDCTLCAVIDAASEEAVWALIATHFPDYKQRFIEPRPGDWAPGDRFR